MFCSGSKSAQPNSSDELVPQALSTTYELIGRVGENSASCDCCHHRKSVNVPVTRHIFSLYPISIPGDPCNGNTSSSGNLLFYTVPPETTRRKLASLMDKRAEMQKMSSKTTLKKNTHSCINATYHLPCWCTHSLSLPPTFPFRFGTMRTPLRVQVWGRITENTPRLGIQTSAIICSLWQMFSYLLYLRNNKPWLTYPGLPQRLAMNICPHMCVCVHTWIPLCLIGIVSISKRPDSHPASLRETKGRAADDAEAESAVHAQRGALAV